MSGSASGASGSLRDAPSWFWIALAAGAGLRAFLVLATVGTDDVAIWQTHAGWTHEHGLVGYYARSEVMNHPPFVARLMQGLWLLMHETGVPFRIWLRAPTALLDLGSALVLVALFRGHAQRFAVGAAYALSPLAWLFSSYHGNTDSVAAFAMLLAVLAAARDRPGLSGAVIGAGLWIKLPVLLAVPAVFLALPEGRGRLRFGACLAGVGIATYLPVLAVAPGLLVERVFLYAGRSIETPGGTPIWGVWSLFGLVDALPDPVRGVLATVADAHRRANTLVCWLPILLLCWLRRRERDALGLGTSVCASLCTLFGLTQNVFAFQYLAWIAPFVFFPGPRFAALATLLLGGYAYGVYAFLTGTPLLLGRWDFGGTPDWPLLLRLLRDAAVLFCLVSAVAFGVAAGRREWRLRAEARR